MIGPRKTFADQGFPKRSPVSHDEPELAAIAILVARYGLKRNRPGIEQLLQPPCGPVPKLGLGNASGRMRFRRVDIGNADFDALHPDRIAIDHAVDPAPDVAEAETGFGL